VDVEDLLGIHEVIDMVAHRHEQVEEDFPPVDAVSQVLTIQRLASGWGSRAHLFTTVYIPHLHLHLHGTTTLECFSGANY
jgi:hypothetical protein